MLKHFIVLFFVLSFAAKADVIDYGPPQDSLGHWEVDIYDSSGNQRGTDSNPFRFDPTGTTAQPASQSGAWTVASTQSGSWTVGRTWNLSSGSDSISAVQSGTWNLNNITGTISLPTGASTSANQTNGSAKTQIIGLLGVNQIINPYGSARVSVEGGALFDDAFIGSSLETTNKWNAPITSGSGAISVGSGALNLATGTSASSSAILTSQTAFPAQGLSYIVWGAAVQFEASPVSGSTRFWGRAVYSGTTITDGVGFLLSGSTLTVVVYQGGTQTFASTISTPTDGAYHRYAFFKRQDAIFFYLDNLDSPVATAGYMPTQAATPLAFSSVNGGSTLSSAPVFNCIGVGVADSGMNNMQISDGSSHWRKATVKAASTSPTSTDTSLVVGISPIGNQIQGNAASGSADSGNGVKVSGVYNTTVPSVTNGQRSDIQTDSRGAIQVTALDGPRATYSAGVEGLVLASAATDFFTITGSSTKTIRITYIEISGTQNTGSAESVTLLKRSSANSGGTSSTLSAVPHDSNSASATATVHSYTANPTSLGTLVGIIRSVRAYWAPSTGGSSAIESISPWEFGKRSSQAIVLHGTGDVLAFNFNGSTAAGSVLDISIEWTEE